MHYTLPPHKRAEEGRPGEKNQCGSGRVGTPLPFSSTLLNPLPWPHDERAEGGGPGEKKTSVEVEGFGPLYPSLVHPPHPSLASRLFSPTPWFLTFKILTWWLQHFLKKLALTFKKICLLYSQATLDISLYKILPHGTRRL